MVSPSTVRTLTLDWNWARCWVGYKFLRAQVPSQGLVERWVVERDVARADCETRIRLWIATASFSRLFLTARHESDIEDEIRS